jgi:hypothetical protein
MKRKMTNGMMPIPMGVIGYCAFRYGLKTTGVVITVSLVFFEAMASLRAVNAMVEVDNESKIMACILI